MSEYLICTYLAPISSKVCSDFAPISMKTAAPNEISGWVTTLDIHINRNISVDGRDMLKTCKEHVGDM